MQRRLTPEQMDAPDAPREVLADALAYLRWVNRRLGGASALITNLQRWSVSWPKGREITLLDVGTGSGDIPLEAVRWARSRGLALRVTGIDNHATTVELAREHCKDEPNVEIVQASALDLRTHFAARQFDYVHAGLFLHHLRDVGVLNVLAGIERVANVGVVWSDLHRSRFHRVMVNAFLIGANKMVRHDARVSVEAGFTKREVLSYAKRTDLSFLRYRRAPLWYRFTLAGERPGIWTSRFGGEGAPPLATTTAPSPAAGAATP
jgi:SAM-dependent methyltransferase